MGKVKTLSLNMGSIITPASSIGIPDMPPGPLRTGYYTSAGVMYYYDAITTQWYYYSAGYLYPLAVISWKPSPSPLINLSSGDILRVNLTFKYMGPEVERDFIADIGNNDVTKAFDRWLGCEGKKKITLPAKSTPTLITDKFVDIVVPDWNWYEFWQHHGEYGGVRCRIDGEALEEGKGCTPNYYDVCYIIAEAGEFSDLAITSFEKV